MAGLFRLSRKFRETIGDDLAEEIEAGFDRVDAINSVALRELFEAKLDQRFGDFRAEMDKRFVEFQAELRQEMATMKAELKQDISDLRVALASTESRLVRWIFLFWLGTIGISMLQK
ncbi:MAG: hypothetical protein HY700_04910 [Gemmatimonadetes bacterium]|nr:hypothetical protein [Gemmatimonadota bacterium]